MKTGIVPLAFSPAQIGFERGRATSVRNGGQAKQLSTVRLLPFVKGSEQRVFRTTHRRSGAVGTIIIWQTSDHSGETLSRFADGDLRKTIAKDRGGIEISRG